MMDEASRAYRLAAARDADSVQLVIMLHDMVIDDLHRCLAALRSRSIEARTHAAGHALLVLDQLQRGLDLKNGGESASNMDRLYSLSRIELLRAQANADAGAFDKQLAIFTSLREAWVQAQTARRVVTPAVREPMLDDGDATMTKAWTA